MGIRSFKPRRVSDTGHLTYHKLRNIGPDITRKLKEWVAQGRISPTSPEERKMRMDYLEKEAKRKRRKKK